MKKLLFFSFILVGVITPWNVESSSLQFLSHDDPEEQIELAGDVNNTGIGSVLTTPIKATIGSNFLNAYFLYNVGNINVQVYNSSGELIYQTNVNTSTQSSISIDVTEWDSDFYEVRFVSSTEQYMDGMLIIE